MKHLRLYIFLYFTAGWLFGSRIPLHGLTSSETNRPLGRTRRTGDRLLPGDGAVALGIPRHAPLPFGLVVSSRGRASGRCHLLSLVHTSLMWASRLILFPLFGLGSLRLRPDAGALSDGVPWAVHPLLHVGGSLYRISQLAPDQRNRKRAGRGATDSALSHRLQPHFLFNALNAVSAAIYEDPARADECSSASAIFSVPPARCRNRPWFRSPRNSVLRANTSKS